MIKFVYLLAAFPLLLTAQTKNVGINTNNPEALLDIQHKTGTPTAAAGITITTVREFPNINPTAEQNGMLINYTGNSLNRGLYYWDHNQSRWQYIFQNSTIKNNLAKVSYISTTGFEQIPAGTHTDWKKTNFNIINTPDSNFKINSDGNIVIGETGNFNLYFTGGITQTSSTNTATSCQIDIVRIASGSTTETVIRSSSLVIPAPDHANRSSNSTISLNTLLTKGDIIIVRTKRSGTSTTATFPATNYAVILSKLSN